MLTTVEGIYRNGRVELVESPGEAGEEARVLVTFLPDENEGARSVDLRERGIDAEAAAALRARLAPFAEDWNSPDMACYDDYDDARSRR